MNKDLLDESEPLACLIADLRPHHAQNDVLRLRRLARLQLLRLLRLRRHVGLLDLLLFRRRYRRSDGHGLHLLLLSRG